MRTNEIKRMIAAAVQHEEETGILLNAIRTVVRQHSIGMTEDEIQGTVKYARLYAECVPFFLEQAWTKATQVGLQVEMEQMIGELETYWFTTNDMLPDALGLAGILDDAYATMTLLQALSEYSESTLGSPLLQQDFRKPNQIIRSLIGEQVAMELDRRLGVTISNAMWQRLIGAVVSSGVQLGGVPSSWEAMYGSATPAEVANARLGAMGVV